MRFVYTRRGGPLLNWSGPTPPTPSRAGETRQLGDFDVPRPGAPEIISGYEAPQPGAGVIHLGAEAQKPFDRSIVRRGAVIAAAYHGVKRNKGSVFWGLAWAAAAYVAPLNGLLVPALGVAQGFGKAK